MQLLTHDAMAQQGKARADIQFALCLPCLLCPAGFLRTYVLELDPAQYQLDVNATAAGEAPDVYATFNVLMRRDAKENNFKVCGTASPSVVLRRGLLEHLQWRGISNSCARIGGHATSQLANGWNSEFHAQCMETETVHTHVSRRRRKWPHGAAYTNPIVCC